MTRHRPRERPLMHCTSCISACRRGVAFIALVLGLGPELAAGIRYDDVDGRATVETKLGVVVGRALPNGVNAFLGMPYALPPVGKLRFEPPVPLASWGTGKREALNFGAECMQTTANNPSPPNVISEDCLFLNVWMPPDARKKGAKLPVMVWLYGGGFQQGASSHPEYDGGRLAKRGVVVVSINYRLGALGWMVSVTDNLWGNYGLQDQRLGMEWVHDNIAAFGGDPGRVTLFGESAGAMSIGQHLHMDGAGVLFHQVIMQSNPLGYRFRSVTVANFLGEAMKRGLDCVNLACLRNEPAADVMRVQESLMGVPRSVGDFFTWGPVVTDRNYRRHVGKHQKRWSRADSEEFRNSSRGMDKERNYRDVRSGPDYDYTAPFMNVAQPLEVWSDAAGVSSADIATGGIDFTASGAASGNRRGARRGSGRMAERDGDAIVPPPVPVMLGVNVDEGLMFVHGAFPLTMPKLVYYSFVAALFRQSVLAVLRTYGPLADQCEESGDYRRVMSQIMHDYLFRCPNQRAAHLLQEQYGRATPVFVYEFSHPTEVPGFPECSGMSCHTAELPFVFDNLAVISEQYSYHQTSGPAAPAPPITRADGHGKGNSDCDIQDGDGDSSRSFNVAGVVGSALGAVQWGVVSTVKSGFGIGKLFGGDRRKSEETSSARPPQDGGDQAMASPGEEVASAVGSVEGIAEAAVSAAATFSGAPDDANESGSAAEGTPNAGRSDEEGGAMSCAAAEVGGLGTEEVNGCDTASAEEASNAGEVSSGARASEDGDTGEGLGKNVGEGGGTFSEEKDGKSSERPRPTAEDAAEADALVGDAMAWYWASFGKVGDPNSSRAPILWPAWEGGRTIGQQNAANAAAMAAVIAAGSSGKVSFSNVFTDAWSHGGVAGGGGSAPGTWGSGVAFVLDIKARPEVKESQRDCVCEFWDRLKYRH